MSSRWGLSGTTPVDANGTPYPLATLDFYITGSTTRTDAYSNAGLTSALANPYTLGSDGLIPDVFLTQVRYKIVLSDADANVIATYDPVDKSVERIKAASAPSPTYPGLQYHNTNDGHLYERNAANDAWIDRGAVDSLLNAATVADQFTGTSTALASTPASVGALWLAGTAVTISANNISLPSTGGGVFSCASASTTLTTISSSTEGREIEIIFSNAQTITDGSGINVLTGETTKIPAGSRVRLRRNASSWTILWWTKGPFQGVVGATNLVVQNSGGTSTTQIAVTADTAILESATNAWCVKHQTVSVTINLATTGANALDTGAQASSTWYYVWLISDGATVAGLASTSSTSPTMPSGYKYKLRVGAMRSGGATTLLRTKQVGKRARYIVAAGSNTTLLPQMVAPGNNSTRVAIAVGAFVPTTATMISVVLGQNGSVSGSLVIAPNNDAGFGATGAAMIATPAPGATFGGGGASVEAGAISVEMLLESTNIYYSTAGSASGNTTVNAYGWTDAVMA